MPAEFRRSTTCSLVAHWLRTPNIGTVHQQAILRTPYSRTAVPALRCVPHSCAAAAGASSQARGASRPDM